MEGMYSVIAIGALRSVLINWHGYKILNLVFNVPILSLMFTEFVRFDTFNIWSSDVNNTNKKIVSTE